MKRRAASVAEVRRTTEADRSTNPLFHSPFDPIQPWVAIDTHGYQFFADTEDDARAMCEQYNGLRPPRREAVAS
jgi:hypothetical protein